MTPRAITGLGIACALGTGAASFFEALRSGRTPDGERPIASFDASKYRDVPILEAAGFEPSSVLGDKGLRVLDRLTKLLLVAARLGLKDARLKEDGRWLHGSAETIGICCSNAYGSLEAITELDRVAKLEDARYINPAKFPNTVSNSAAGYVSIWEDIRALNVSVSDGNCGALDAVACADVFLATERAEVILTGGGEAMSEPLFVAFDKLGAIGRARLGEGAAFLALETLEHAHAREAHVLGEIAGYGTAFVAPPEEATLLFASRTAVERAISQALVDAGIGARDVDVVASGVAGLEPFQAEELAGIESVLGDVAVAAPKFLHGETLGAGGALGIATALGWLGGTATGPLVRGTAPASAGVVLVTSLGYYGNASAVVVRRSAA